jgi:hypothetical protein
MPTMSMKVTKAITGMYMSGAFKSNFGGTSVMLTSEANLMDQSLHGLFFKEKFNNDLTLKEAKKYNILSSEKFSRIFKNGVLKRVL